ncbi:PD-(D/E)XK nuclease family protein [Rhodococcus sp. X156]|uniref:RecB family exonuclease n=1 Tax=Rhodococcus sp. X156 TaxID=2499145 RepID=UPI0019D02CC9|nr:PD-(D/E)XK nuclease family protein [Rhodococcus sp. X156]
MSGRRRAVAPGGSDQLGLDGMPTRLVKVTPSKLGTWTACRRRYRMTYLDRPAPPRAGAWAHNTVGAVVHAALRTFFDQPAARRTVEDARAQVRTAWSAVQGASGFADAEQSARYRERAQDWVADYVESLDGGAAEVEPVGLERWVAAPVGAIVAEGRVDRIDARVNEQAPEGTELVVVDYKTGRRPLTVDDARGSQALALYVLATRRTLRKPCRRVELHHLPTGEVLAFDHTPESLARHQQRAEESAQEIQLTTDTLAAGGDPDVLFPPSPGAQCSWCDVRRSCDLGRQAPELAPWAGLAP